MEYRDVLERINGASNIDEILEKICSIYKIGNYIKHKIIEIGYEDFNVILDTNSGRYFVKILNQERTDEECERLATIYHIARNHGVNVPLIYKNQNKLVEKIKMQNVTLRILLMEYIKGSNMYELERDLTLEEIEQVAYQAAKINKIDFNIQPYYDEWTLTNFKKEYEKKFNLICEEDKQIVEEAYREFIKLDLEDLPKSYIHGDIMNANLIKDEEKIWLIDFSAVNYLPRILELVVIAYGICINDNRKESIKRLNYFLNKYNEQNKITKLELDQFSIVLNAMGAMSIMQASYIKANNGNFKENQYWIDKGKEVIELKLQKEEIELVKNKMEDKIGGFKMEKNNDFFNRVKNLVEPEIEKGINSGNPYTICDLLEKTKGGPNGIYLRKLENAIIETKDIVQIYEFMFLAVDMSIIGFDRERFERIIRQSKNPKLMCYCMAFVPGTNIEAMSKALIDTQNAKYMEMLIKDEEYEEVLEEIKQIDAGYEETVEKAKQFDYYPESLKQFIAFKDDIAKLKDEVKATRNPHLITELANYIEYLNEYKGESYEISDLVFAQEETEDPMQAYEFLASVKVKNKSGLIQNVLGSGKVKFAYYVYTYVPGLTKQEKKQIKENIEQEDSDGKYKQMIEDEIVLEDESSIEHT